jgi:alginate production protein
VARGRVEGERLSAYGWDAGLTFRLPGRWEPALTVAHAFGSGDDAQGDGVTRTFRQTGLHDDNGKWAGVTSFRFYGEVLDPELANLVIESAGFGVRPRDFMSVELIGHRYRQDEPAAALVDSAAGDRRRLNLIDDDIGQEWDLVVAWEQLVHWEVELNLGVFQPGRAFLGDRDDAWGTSLKLKYVF